MASQEIINVVLNLVDNVSKGLDNINKKTETFADRANSLSRALAPVSLAAGAALGGSAKLAIDFEKSLNEASKSLSLTAPQLAEFRKEAFRIQENLDFQYSAAQIASLAAEAGKLGVERENLAAYTEGLIKLAVATDNTKNIEKLNTNVAKVNAIFKMGVPELEDYYAAVNRLADTSAANANEILNFSKRISGTAKSAGISAKQIAAWGAAIIGAGVDVSSAEGFLKNMNVTLSATEMWSDRQSAAFGALGYSAEEMGRKYVQDANGAMMELMTTLKTLQQTDPQQFNNVISKIFGREWVGKAKLSNEALSDIVKNFGLVGESAMNAARFQAEFDKQSATVTGQLNSLKNMLGTIGIELGTVLLPIMVELVQAMKPLLMGIINFIRQNPGIAKVIVTLIGITAVIAPVLAVVGAVTSLVTALAPLAPFIGAVAAAVGGIVLAMAPWIAAIAAVAGGAYLIYSNWDGIAEWFSVNVINPIVSNFNRFVDWFRNDPLNAALTFAAWFTPLPTILGQNLGKATQFIANWIRSLPAWGVKIRDMAVGWGRGLIKGFINGMQSLYGDAQNAMDNFTSWLGQYLPHSDAKKGELSNLTASGMSFAETFLNGINRGLGNNIRNLVLPGNGGEGSLSNSITPPFPGSGSVINFNPVYNIDVANMEDVMRMLQERDREVLEFIDRSSGRLNRNAY